MATRSDFKSVLVWYDEQGYLDAERDAQLKLSYLDDASVWIHNQLGLDDSKINMKRLHLNMVEYFKDALLSRYKDVNLLELSASKLIEAKQIPIGELTKIQEAYENAKLKSDVVFNDNVPSVEVNKKDFEQWTNSTNTAKIQQKTRKKTARQ